MEVVAPPKADVLNPGVAACVVMVEVDGGGVAGGWLNGEGGAAESWPKMGGMEGVTNASIAGWLKAEPEEQVAGGCANTEGAETLAVNAEVPVAGAWMDALGLQQAGSALVTSAG